MKKLHLAALVAMAAFAPAVRAADGDLLQRYELDIPEYTVTDPNILAGLPAGATAIVVPKGVNLPATIPSDLLDRPGHPYTLAMKIKTRVTNDWVCLLNMPSSNDSDAMVYLDRSTRQVCIKQFNKNQVSARSDRGVELDRWTVLAFAFGEDETAIFLDGDPVYWEVNERSLTNSCADCYYAGGSILIGADDNGDDNPFYLADVRLYDGAVVVGDELLGTGTPFDPFRIATVADWGLFATNVNLGRVTGEDMPCYRLENDLGSASAPLTLSVGEEGAPFRGVFDGNSHTLRVALSGDAPGTAPFGRTARAYIENLTVAGTVSSTADHAAGLVGICDGLTVVSNCTVSASVTVSGADHAGGIVGNAGTGNTVWFRNNVFSGAISGPAAHAGGLIGWSGPLETLILSNCLFKGSYSGSGKWHPVACMEPGSTIAAQDTGNGLYYLNTALPTEDADHVIPGAEGAAVSETLVPGSWTMPVTAADGNVYYRDAVHITPSTGAMSVCDGDVLTGTGGSNTVLYVRDGATVTLRNVDVTAAPDDTLHPWAAVMCEGDAVLVLEGTNALKGGHAYLPAIFVRPGQTLVIRGDGTLDARSNGKAAGIGAYRGTNGACGNIVIEGGTITATGGQYAAGIGASYQATCGSITITGGNVTATGGQYGAGIGGGYQADCGTIAISGGTVTATSGEFAAAIGSGPVGNCAGIEISGGTVTATGGLKAPGIGAASSGGTCGAISVTGGTVEATGTQYSAGIGGGGESQCGDIAITEGVLRVTAAHGENCDASVGAGFNATCGTVTVAGAETGPIAENPWTYAPGIVEISSLADWEAFAARVNGGVDSYAGETVTLAADLGPVTTPVGNQNHPFRGTFEGGGHVLTAALEGTDYFVAPFSAIGGATIANLAVAGTVSGGMHCSGLVGAVVGGTNAIENCAVSAAITSSGSHFGGFVGHSITNAVTLRGCLFSGTLSGGTYVATFHAWSDGGATTTLLDCFDASESSQPLGRGADAACVSNTYYLASKNFGNPERLWSEPNRGKRAHTVTEGEGVSIDFGDPAASYATSGIDAYAPGVVFQGGTFRAGAGDAVPLLLSAALPVEAYAASAGSLSGSGSAWTLAMPDEPVVVSIRHGNLPQAALDSCEGRTNAVHVNGWAYDPDASAWSCDVEVRIYTDAACTTQYGEPHVLKTDVLRTDVNRAKGIEGIHGFDADIPGVFAGTYWVKVFALDATGDGSVQINAAARSVTVTGVSLVELTADSADVVLADGEGLTGTGGPNTHVTIADGATVTLYNVTIDATNQSWAGITCLGSATIVLAGTNSVQGGIKYSGIYVPSGQTLLIRGDGSLSATGGKNGAGIGAGYESTNSCGNIVIEDGTITATGGRLGAGIGGSYHASCGDIAILGGTVTATGAYRAAGIGCGALDSSCGNIAIASDVTRLEATAGDLADAIGEGWSASSIGTVAIGGTETGPLCQRHVVYPVEPGTYTIHFDKNNDAATGTMADLEVLANTPQQLPACGFTTDGTHVFRSWNTAADGSGETFAEGHTLFNYGDATLFAQWTAITYAIAYPGATDGEMNVENPNPTSYTYDSADITLADPVRFGYVFAGWTCEGQDTPTQSVVIPHGSSGDKTFTAHWSLAPTVTVTTAVGELLLLDGQTLAGTGGQNTHVTIADGATVTIDGVDITALRPVNPWAGITCLGDATLVLRGENAVKGGLRSAGIFVPEGKTLAIRGEGSLTTTGTQYAAGIGGNNGTNCGSIAISGGTVTATGGYEGAAIGAGYYGSCGDIVISGGTVTATGGVSSAALGSGYNGSCDGILISGGTVSATGGKGGAGIGSGSAGSCGDITISGGTVTATSSNSAAGIGGGFKGSCDNITISSGTVTAAGSAAGAGIGSGNQSLCGDIFIKGGDVTAAGGSDGAGIGSGKNSSCGNIVIGGGTITAIGASGHTAAIGCGRASSSEPSSCGDITIAGGVACVTATRGLAVAGINFIGSSGTHATCGTVTIDPILKQVLSNGDLTLTLYPFLELRDDADNAAAIAAADGRTLPVQLAGRTLTKDGSWQTLCLPFDLTAEQVAAQLAPSALATLRSSSFADGTLVLAFADALAIEAGRPYVVRWDAGDDLVDPVFEDVSVRDAAAPVETAFADFLGTFSPVEISAADPDAVLFGTGGLPVRPADDTLLGACRAWFRLKGTAADGAAVRFEVTFGATGPYDLWAAANGIVGPWDAVDADGIANVFRYLFDKPAGTAGLAIQALHFGEDGIPVIVTSPLVNTQGFTCTVTAFAPPLWTTPTATHPLSPTGQTPIPPPSPAPPSLFFRLEASPTD